MLSSAANRLLWHIQARPLHGVPMNLFEAAASTDLETPTTHALYRTAERWTACSRPQRGYKKYIQSYMNLCCEEDGPVLFKQRK